ncbi:MAG: class I SAM-dependent methyltransferase, partial [gamma proteobacterium symbiont of Phacoides pectinatus]
DSLFQPGVRIIFCSGLSFAVQGVVDNVIGSVKKEMRLFRQLVGEDHDTDELLRAARARARVRVVVKRPARAGFAGAAEPAYSISSPNTRYDVYLTGAAAI